MLVVQARSDRLGVGDVVAFSVGGDVGDKSAQFAEGAVLPCVTLVRPDPDCLSHPVVTLRDGLVSEVACSTGKGGAKLPIRADMEAIEAEQRRHAAALAGLLGAVTAAELTGWSKARIADALRVGRATAHDTADDGEFGATALRPRS